MPSATRHVAVSGGAGFIGTHTVRRLLDGGHRVLVIDDFRHACGVPVPSQADLVRADIASPAAADALQRFRPDAVLHLAARGGVSRSVQDPQGDALVNVVGTVALLKAASDADCKRFVFSSSGGAIYGRARRLPSRESDRPQPLSPYGAAKLACEVYLWMFARTFGLSAAALRYGNIYGPFQDGTGEAGVVAISCWRLIKRQCPEIRGDGAQTRDFTFVGDVAEANLQALLTPAQGAFNIGTGRATSVREVVETLVDVHGGGVQAKYVAPRPGEVRTNFLDPSRARRFLGWQARTTLDAGLATTLASFREQSQILG